MNSYRQIVTFHVDSLQHHLRRLHFLSLDYLRQLWVPFLNNYAFYIRVWRVSVFTADPHKCLFHTKNQNRKKDKHTKWALCNKLSEKVQFGPVRKGNKSRKRWKAEFK